jgi:hypothetical protein
MPLLRKYINVLSVAVCLLPINLHIESAHSEDVVVGDQQLQITLACDSHGLREKEVSVHGKRLDGPNGVAWIVETDRGTMRSDQGESHPLATSQNPRREVSFTGQNDAFQWTLAYQATGNGRITKQLSLTPRGDLLIKRVALFDTGFKTRPAVCSTSLTDVAAFFRQGTSGMFASLDFPYSAITIDGANLKIGYPPFEKAKKSEQYSCHSLTLGAVRLTGYERYGFDEGEAAAMDAYVQERFSPRFERPMFVGCSINNRYTMPHGDIVFQTMKDHPSLGFHLDLMKSELALASQLGMEFYQLFPGPFDSVPGDPEPKDVDEIVKVAKQHGVRVGDYSGTSAVFCAHYNEHRNTLEGFSHGKLTAADVCFGNPKFIQFYRDTVTGTARRYGFDLHCLDFLNIHECNAPHHGHPPGRDSIYAQVRGLTEILSSLNDVSPNMMTWSNSGNWAELLPKIAWTNHNLYLTDPFIASPWQGLNMTRLLDDARREQMVSLHYSRFIPYRYLTNCQYFFCQNSVVPDVRNYQYGALSTLAVTPNLCLGEIRPWLDRLPDNQRQEVVAFYKKWTALLTANFGLWKKTYQVGENPGMGSVEIYGHAKGSQGFVFVVNPQYWSRTVEVPLDASLGFSGTSRCELSEFYPVERRRLTEQGRFVRLGTSIRVHVPAQTVLVLAVKPAPDKIDAPRLYGLPGTIEATSRGYLLKTWGAQGRTERCAVLLPEGSKPIVSATVRNVPKQPKRLWANTPIHIAAQNAEGIAADVTFRRDAAPDELRQWEVKPGSLAEGTAAGWTGGFKDGTALRFPLFVDAASVRLPLWDADADKLGLGPLANFCGAYVENAFAETQETWIDLVVGEKANHPKGNVAAHEPAIVSHPMPEIAMSKSRSWWTQTSFHLPFMYTIGAEPSLDEHTLLVLPFVRQSRVRAVSAWINGAPLEVRKYQYPRNRALSCFYADLVGTAAVGGENRLVVHYETDASR